MEVTNCVRGTFCYEYNRRLMQSGRVIPVSGARRAQARQRQTCPQASLTHNLYSVIVSLLLCALNLSLVSFLYLSLSFSPSLSLSSFPFSFASLLSLSLVLCSFLNICVARKPPSDVFLSLLPSSLWASEMKDGQHSYGQIYILMYNRNCFSA